MGIGDRLKEERLRLGMNQTDFASMTGVTKNSQLNYEKGDRTPDASYLAAAYASGVDVLYVLTGGRTPTPADSLSEKESTVLKQYRSLGPADQASLDRLIDALAETADTYKAEKKAE